eukprot:TRINITY_DN6369_c0_g1_i2.p1 TRINITY_DN6369_c0_g1~~TRINITY_DN6369_c0_g1_i2.p1  ORF type:complete len:148 (-),score=41.83 TRINITY_DN6369_c0_g1_i2:53-496(-)
MDSYSLTREDWDTVMEVTLQDQPDKAIQTTVKSAFTRKYNAAHKAIKAAPTRKGASSIVLREEAEAMHLEEEGEYDEQNEEEDDSKDTMIKEKKPHTSRTAPRGKKATATQQSSEPEAPKAKKARAPRGAGRGKAATKKKPLDFIHS